MNFQLTKSAYERVEAALQRFGLVVPSAKRVRSNISLLFDAGIHRYAGWLSAPDERGPVPEWTLITGGPGLPPTSYSPGSYFTDSVVGSRADAIGVAMFEIDSGAIEAVRVDVSPRLITIHGRGGALFSIEPVAFDSAYAEFRPRVEQDLKGLRLADVRQLWHTLSKIPGLEQVEWKGHLRGRDQGGIASLTPNSFVMAFQASLVEAGVKDVKLSQSQEILASLLRLRDWQRLIQNDRDDRATERWTVPYGLRIRNEDGSSTLRIYRSQAEGIWAYGAEARRLTWCEVKSEVEAKSEIGVTLIGTQQAADLPENFDFLSFPRPEVVLSAAPLHEYVDASLPPYSAKAAILLRDPRGLSSALGEALGVQADLKRRVHQRAERLGMLPGKSLWIGNTLIYIAAYEKGVPSPKHDFVRISQFDAAGGYLGDMSSLYSSIKVLRNDSDGLVIRGSSAKDEVVLGNVSDADFKALKAMLEISTYSQA